jgi:hypothetical protein
MRKLLASIALSCLAAHGAQADMIVKQTSGYWTFADGTNDSGNHMCNAQISGGNFHFYLKNTAGKLFLQVGQDGWSIPTGTRVKIILTFDGTIPLSLNMTGAGALMMAELDMTTKRTSDEYWMTYFLNLMRHSANLRVTFPEGHNGAWSLNMTGSRVIIDAFSECSVMQSYRIWEQGHPGAQQPYSAQQPFGAYKYQPG